MLALNWKNSKLDPVEPNGINRRDSVVIDNEENYENESTIVPCWRKNLGWIIFLVVVILGIAVISLVAIYLSYFPATIVATKDLEKKRTE